MKKSTKKTLEWTAILVAAAAAVGAGAFVVYEKEMVHKLVLTPGTIAGQVPSDGQTTFVLPSGAKSWVQGISTSGAAPSAVTVPSGAGNLKLATPKGSAFEFTWVDGNGATQASIVAFA